MKKIIILLAVSISILACTNKVKELKPIINNEIQVNDESINYSKIDSSILQLSGLSYKRLDKNWMEKRALNFKSLGIDTSLNGALDWPINCIIEATLDNDNIKDYIVITKSEFHPKFDINYAIIAVLGKNYKSYQIPEASYMTFLLEELPSESKDFTKYELPHIKLEKNKKIDYIYLWPNRMVDGYNPYFYDKKTDKFEMIAFD